MRQWLKEHYQETFNFTARFQCYAKTPDDSNVACFASLRVNGEFCADHIWTHRSKLMKNLDLQNGDLVAFEARITRYARNESFSRAEDVIYDYGVEKIREFQVLRRASKEETNAANIPDLRP